MTIFEKELKNMFDSNDLIKEKAYSGKSLIGIEMQINKLKTRQG